LNDRLSLTLRSSLTEVERLGREFAAFADSNGLAPEARFVMNLALEEVVTNVIAHSYQGRDDQVITVEVALAPGAVTARVEDSAPPFDPLQLPPPDVSAPLEQRRGGGLGVHLSRTMLDGLQYSRVGGKNRLDLRKLLPRD
jgi:anti-sigma regulatory factor (Ser/Thr protein kinase)